MRNCAEKVENCGSPPRSVGILRVRGASEHHGLRFPAPPQGREQLYPGALACMQGHCSAFPATSPRARSGSEGRKQAGSTGHFYMHLASPPGAALAWQASAQGTVNAHLAPMACQNHPAHRAYTGVTSTQGHFFKTGKDSYFV